MKVKEVVAKLLVCDQEAEVTSGTGVEIVQVVRNTMLQQVSVLDEDLTISEAALNRGWEIVR